MRCIVSNMPAAASAIATVTTAVATSVSRVRTGLSHLRAPGPLLSVVDGTSPTVGRPPVWPPPVLRIR